MTEEQNEPQQSEGQVSEVQRMDEDDADTPVSDSDYTAGDPGEDHDHTDNAGPDAVPEGNRRDNELKPGGGGPAAAVEDE